MAVRESNPRHSGDVKIPAKWPDLILCHMVQIAAVSNFNQRLKGVDSVEKLDNLNGRFFR